MDKPINRTAVTKLPMPREHGAWGILLIPFAPATGVAGVGNLPLALLLVSIMRMFRLADDLVETELPVMPFGIYVTGFSAIIYFRFVGFLFYDWNAKAFPSPPTTTQTFL